MLSDNPGRVRSEKTSVVCHIQQFDFDCNLLVTRKVIHVMGIAPALGINPLYIHGDRQGPWTESFLEASRAWLTENFPESFRTWIYLFLRKMSNRWG